MPAHFRVTSPNEDQDRYGHDLCEIVHNARIDVVIPCEHVFHVSQTLKEQPPSVRVMCSEFALLKAVHNKFTFTRMVEECGVLAPRTRLCGTYADVVLAISAFHSEGSVSVYALASCMF